MPCRREGEENDGKEEPFKIHLGARGEYDRIFDRDRGKCNEIVNVREGRME